METPSYLQRRLIQNYYEIHGNFDGIISTPVGDVVSTFANITNRTVEEACYNFLGYVKVSNNYVPRLFMMISLTPNIKYLWVKKRLHS